MIENSSAHEWKWKVQDVYVRHHTYVCGNVRVCVQLQANTRCCYFVLDVHMEVHSRNNALHMHLQYTACTKCFHVCVRMHWSKTLLDVQKKYVSDLAGLCDATQSSSAWHYLRTEGSIYVMVQVYKTNQYEQKRTCFALSCIGSQDSIGFNSPNWTPWLQEMFCWIQSSINLLLSSHILHNSCWESVTMLCYVLTFYLFILTSTSC